MLDSLFLLNMKQKINEDKFEGYSINDELIGDRLNELIKSKVNKVKTAVDFQDSDMIENCLEEYSEIERIASEYIVIDLYHIQIDKILKNRNIEIHSKEYQIEKTK